MPQSVGLYRMHYGSAIVQSFYDYDICKIGPYTIPVSLTYNEESGSTNQIPMYRLYQELLEHEGTLAVFNVNNYCIASLYKDRLVQVPIVKNDDSKDLVMWSFSKPIEVPTLLAVGFVKTYQRCLAVTEAPHYLLMDFERNLIGLKSKMDANPMVNPPYSLYKELIGNEQAKAIYFDVDKNEPAFIYE